MLLLVVIFICKESIWIVWKQSNVMLSVCCQHSRLKKRKKRPISKRMKANEKDGDPSTFRHSTAFANESKWPKTQLRSKCRFTVKLVHKIVSNKVTTCKRSVGPDERRRERHLLSPVLRNQITGRSGAFHCLPCLHESLSLHCFLDAVVLFTLRRHANCGRKIGREPEHRQRMRRQMA